MEGAENVLEKYKVGYRVKEKSGFGGDTYFTLSPKENHKLMKKGNDGTQLILYPHEGNVCFQFCDRDLKN